MDKLKFLHDYADVVFIVDIMKISSFFNDSFMLSKQKECWYIKNNDEFRNNLKKAFLGYEYLGANHCKLLTYDLINFNSNHLKESIMDYEILLDKKHFATLKKGELGNAISDYLKKYRPGVTIDQFLKSYMGLPQRQAFHCIIQ